MDTQEQFECGNCGQSASPESATRTETMGELDPETWQTLCCPHCGTRLETVFVGET